MKRIFFILLTVIGLSVTTLYAEVATQTNVTRLYIATFDRTPDQAGLDYWVESSGLSLEDIATSFFDQEETKEKYPEGYSTVDFIISIYTNLFQRSPDSAGSDYWIGELDSGSISKSVFILAVVNGAVGDDATILETKTEIALSELANNNSIVISNEVSDGYILFSTMGSKSIQLIDNNKTLIKSWTSIYASSGGAYFTNTNNLIRIAKTDNVKNTAFATGGSVAGIIEELDSNSNIIWSFILDNDTNTLHHDFKQIDSNTIIALTWGLETYNGKDYWDEKIIKIDKETSSIIWEWSAMNDGNILPTLNKNDFLHFNSIDYQDGKILVSSREQDKLYLINESDKSIISTLTANNTLVGQHDASFLDNGNILLFNNGDTSISKILELDTNDNIVWEYSNNFYSDHISGVQRLDNGNTLICSGVEGRFIEVSSDKNELWEYTNTYSTQTPKGESNTVFKIRKYENY